MAFSAPAPGGASDPLGRLARTFEALGEPDRGRVHRADFEETTGLL